MNLISTAEWAWLAGLFEGEGCFNFTSKQSVGVVIRMTDRDVLETVDRLVPSPNGLYRVEPRNPKHQMQYVWRVGSRDDAIAFIEGIRPWLHGRRGQRADEALERLRSNRGIHSKKEHCGNGHEWAEVGIYVSPGGKRHCRACMREAVARCKKKKKGRAATCSS